MNTENLKEGFFQRFFSLGDLLRDRIKKKGLERETGDVVQALVQIGAFGRSPWSYFGLVRQTMIEKKTNRKLMLESARFAKDFAETARGLDEKRKRTADEYLKALQYAIANGWNEHAASARKQCESFLEENGLELKEGPEIPLPDLGEDPAKIRIDEEEIGLDEIYHYEVVKPNSAVPKTFILPYSLFKYSPQRRYTETNEGAKTKYKLYSFFMLVFTIAFNVISFIMIGSGFHPGRAAYNYFIIPLVVSMFWLLVMWYIVKMVIGTTWIHTPYLVPFGERTDSKGPQPMLLVNSQSMDLVRSISQFLHTDQSNLDALGETLKSFQEATYSRLKLDNRAKDLKIASLEDYTRKVKIQEDTEELNGQKVRYVRKMPRWAAAALAFMVAATSVFAVLLAMVMVSA